MTDEQRAEVKQAVDAYCGLIEVEGPSVSDLANELWRVLKMYDLTIEFRDGDKVQTAGTFKDGKIQMWFDREIGN